MSDTIHRMVTDRMIAALERGTVPWHKPWHAADGRPTSMTTAQPYRGVNVFLLGLTAAEEGYRSRYWGTYRQIEQLGGQVRKGEHSTLVVFWKRTEVADRDRQTGEVAVRQAPVLRYYRVFNAAQADHLPPQWFYPTPEQDTQIRAPQTVLDGYFARGPAMRHVAGDRAAYHPGADTIRLPLRSQFQSAEHYYATAFHEAAHSTGHPSRLNRPGIAAFDHFGSDRYAREELVAEMTSSILCAETGVDDPGPVRQLRRLHRRLAIHPEPRPHARGRRRRAGATRVRPDQPGRASSDPRPAPPPRDRGGRWPTLRRRRPDGACSPGHRAQGRRGRPHRGDKRLAGRGWLKKGGEPNDRHNGRPTA
jgi:antirestriction protein ArdC